MSPYSLIHPIPICFPKRKMHEPRQRRKDGSPTDLLENNARKDINIDRYKKHLHQSTLIKEKVP
jgi:hypothetical protein